MGHGFRSSRVVGVLCAGVLVTSLASGPAASPGADALPTAATPQRCTIAGVVRTWSLARLARQTIVVPVAETHPGVVAPEVAAGVGGVILFGTTAPANLGTALARLLRQAPGGIAPVVMTDEEGGAVQRMANLVGSMPSARRMAATMTLAQVHRLAHRVGARMAALHVSMNLAPVLDLDDRPGPNATNPDGTRSFSLDPATARAYGLAFARGMRSAGVVPVVKHFPGLGGATANTDLAPAWTRPWSVLQKRGLVPFRAAVAAGLPAVMVTTARVPGLTALPAALSSRVVHDVLRTRLGFQGLVMADSLSGGAVRAAGYSVPRAAVRMLQVGGDMILFNADATQVGAVTHRVVTAIVAAVRMGELSRGRLERAVVHVVRAKRAPVCA